MKHILLILFLLLPVMTFGQSKESKQCYKKGIKLLDAEKYGEALTCFQKSDSLDKAKLKPTHKNYYRAELKMADCYEGIAYESFAMGKYAEAVEYQTKTMEIRKSVLGEESAGYASALTTLAWYIYDLGNIKEAIRLNTIAMDILKRTVGEENPDYAFSLNGLGWFYNVCGDYAKAIEFGTKSTAIYKRVLGEETEEYALSLNNLADHYCATGNYAEAIRLGTRAAEIRKRVLGDDHPDYAQSLNNLASYYDEIGDYHEAQRVMAVVIEIYKRSLGEEHPLYALSLNNIAYCYDEIGNYTEAIRLGNMALEIRKKVLGEKHPDYAYSLSNIADFYFHTGDIITAISLQKNAIEIFKTTLGENHPYYAMSLSGLAEYYLAMGNYTEAIKLGNIVLDIYNKIMGKDHRNYTYIQKALADYYFIDGKYDNAIDLYSQSYRRINSFILNNFSSMTSKERMIFWKLYSKFYSKDLPSAAYIHPDTTLTALAYDAQVFSKGLLLNTELEIQKLIEQSGDTTFANRYYKLKRDRATLDVLYQTSPEKRKINADSLQKVIDNEERLLVESSKALGDYTKNLSISWRDVQKKLKDNDLAIEFVNFKDTAAKKEIYAALILKPDMNSPEFVKLFDRDEFFEINSDEYYKKSDFYNLVWKKLETYLTGVKNVYFSPSGKFHTIGIEYLPDESGKIFAEKFGAYRLSSTRELALEHKQNSFKKAATYGGIKYDSDKDDGNVRGVATYLKGTKIESETVAKLLRSADFSVIALSDTLATEESFKKLSGTNLKILHIGTHGFYYSESDLENAGFSFFSNNNQQSKEDKALSCSGLLFAGANVALDKETRNALPEGDDGILTAKEISRLDFKGLDLVVLSACQTGLGEVTGEGVFGLQRGFKKAGAQTIVMSLWEVDDYATRLLMTEFFKGLTLGKSKREAFLAALDFVKAKNSDPKYWAAFVMVDGKE